MNYHNIHVISPCRQTPKRAPQVTKQTRSAVEEETEHVKHAIKQVLEYNT